MIKNYEFLLIRNLTDRIEKGKISGICKVNLAYIVIDLREKTNHKNNTTKWVYVVKFVFTNPINNDTENIYINIQPQEIYQTFDINNWLLYLYSNIYKCGKEKVICDDLVQILTEQNVEELVQKSISEFMEESTDNPTKYGFKKEIKKEEN